MTENKTVGEMHGCIVCGRILNILAVYSPTGKLVDCTVTSKGGQIVPDHRQRLAACSSYTADEIDGHRIKAGIPVGVRTGSRVRLASQGEPGISPQPAGDLYLNVRILPNPTFERDGDNLHIEIPVDFFTAITGGEIRVSSLDRPLILKIPPRTNAGQSFRLRGKGMPHLGDPKTRGDLFALVRLVLPDQLTDLEVNSIRELADSRSNSSQAQPK